ncbi:MAG TPA: hypothetical protein VIZ30_02645, partial [Pseudomonadales bacterium]
LMPGTTFAEARGGRTSGTVVRWSPGSKGWEVIRGTELAYNNGIEVSPDGREIYVASSGSSIVVAYSSGNPARRLRATGVLEFVPDNLHLDDHGSVLTAGMKLDEPACGGARGVQDFEKLRSCPRPTIAASIDPATMHATTLFMAPANPVFSNATMAIAVGEALWLGTFSGDRIAIGGDRIAPGAPR